MQLRKLEQFIYRVCLLIFQQFVPKSHYFFSVSKDKTLKYWDADKFEHITTLQVMTMISGYPLLVDQTRLITFSRDVGIFSSCQLSMMLIHFEFSFTIFSGNSPKKVNIFSLLRSYTCITDGTVVLCGTLRRQLDCLGTAKT